MICRSLEDLKKSCSKTSSEVSGAIVEILFTVTEIYSTIRTFLIQHFTGEFSFPEESWGTVSIDAKNLLRKLLVTDPSHRLTSKEAMQSRWMIQRADRLQRNTLLYTSQRLKTFNARMKLRSAMIAVTAMTSARLSIARSIADVVPIESDGESSNDAEDEETKNE